MRGSKLREDNRRKADGTHDNTTRGHPFNYFTQGVGCVEVEVDLGLEGEVGL